MSEEIERDGNYLTREIPGVLSLFLAVTIFLAVISHNPADPSLGSFSTRSGPMRIHNYIGLAGAYFTGVCVDLLGTGRFLAGAGHGSGILALFSRPFVQ